MVLPPISNLEKTPWFLTARQSVFVVSAMLWLRIPISTIQAVFNAFWKKIPPRLLQIFFIRKIDFKLKIWFSRSKLGKIVAMIFWNDSHYAMAQSFSTGRTETRSWKIYLQTRDCKLNIPYTLWAIKRRKLQVFLCTVIIRPAIFLWRKPMRIPLDVFFAMGIFRWSLPAICRRKRKKKCFPPSKKRGKAPPSIL